MIRWWSKIVFNHHTNQQSPSNEIKASDKMFLEFNVKPNKSVLFYAEVLEELDKIRNLTFWILIYDFVCLKMTKVIYLEWNILLILKIRCVIITILYLFMFLILTLHFFPLQPSKHWHFNFILRFFLAFTTVLPFTHSFTPFSNLYN